MGKFVTLFIKRDPESIENYRPVTLPINISESFEYGKFVPMFIKGDPESIKKYPPVTLSINVRRYLSVAFWIA